MLKVLMVLEGLKVMHPGAAVISGAGAAGKVMLNPHPGAGEELQNIVNVNRVFSLSIMCNTI
jgi:hypothetical protein